MSKTSGMTIILAYVALTFTLTACEDSTMTGTAPTRAVLNTKVFETIASHSYFFGHQSVGHDIMRGIDELREKHSGLTLEMVKDPAPGSISPGTLAHARVGGNGDPGAKLSDFVTALDGGLAENVDVAFLKFCYLDFGSSTDAQQVFDAYRETMEGLQARHPNLTIVHLTVPLRAIQSGPRALIKQLLGHPLPGREDNIVKHRFNELLRAHYGGKELLFDIARIESTWPDGRRESFTRDGETAFALVPAYTDDGGHLNQKGREVVAPLFLEFLGTIDG